MTEPLKKGRGGARPGAGRKPKPIPLPTPAQAAVQATVDETMVFLDSVMAEPIKRRNCKLQPDTDTLRTLGELAKLFCSQEEAAAVLGVGKTTFFNFLRDVPEAREVWDDGLQYAKVSLRRKQLALADKNAPAAIFLGKNYLGQKDEHHNTTTITKPATEMSEAELMEIAMRGAVDAPGPKAKAKAH